MKRHITALFATLALLMAATISGCSGKGSAGQTSDGNIFEEAVFIKGAPQAEGAMAVTVVNPWDSTGVLARYLLLNPGAADSAATQAIRLALPLKRLVVYSAVHAALLAELGHADAIVGVADGLLPRLWPVWQMAASPTSARRWSRRWRKSYRSTPTAY